MVNSRGDEMQARPGLERQVQSIERKVDALSASVDALSASVDARFDQVSTAFVEQREYTEFAFDRLRKEMRQGFGELREGFSRLERKLDQFIDAQLRDH